MYYDLTEWNEIKTQDDIATIMDNFGFFHECCIVSMNYTSGLTMQKGRLVADKSINNRIFMTVDSEWCGRIELMFDSVRKFHAVCSDDMYNNYILSATLTFSDRLILWANNRDFRLSENDSDITYILAESLKWRYG